MLEWLPVVLMLLVMIVFLLLFQINRLGKAQARISNQLKTHDNYYLKRLQTLIHLVPDAIVSYDENGIIMDFNTGAESMFGLSSAEARGRSIEQFLLTAIDDSLLDTRENNRTLSDISSMIITHSATARRLSGAEFPVQVSIAEEYLEEKVLFTSMIRDETDRVDMLDAQKLINDELTRANKDLEQFAYVASHDLKAPLRAISNLATWINDDLKEKMDDDSKENMSLLMGRINRLDTLLSDLLLFSRAGRFEGNLDTINSGKVITDVVDLLGIPSGFKVNVSTDLPNFKLHRSGLEMIIRNLILNAIKHHDNSAGAINIKAALEDSIWIFSVIDDGPGIEQQYHQKVFDLFTSLKSSDRTEGSGMGLSICRRAVEALGGEIWIEHSSSSGTEFCFSLPNR